MYVRVAITYTLTSLHLYAHIQYLSLRFVQATVGEEEWRAVGKSNFPVWMLVAGKRSACLPGNVDGMIDMVPRTRVVHFRQAYHWIHNSRLKDFIKAIEDVYRGIDTVTYISRDNSDT